MDYKTEKWGIFGNITGDSTLRDNAKVRLLQLNGGNESWIVEGLNRQGRRIQKYAKINRIHNWRPGLLNPSRPESTDCGIVYTCREEAEQDCPRDRKRKTEDK